jgi:hypothetical protein
MPWHPIASEFFCFSFKIQAPGEDRGVFFWLFAVFGAKKHKKQMETKKRLFLHPAKCVIIK